MKYILTVFLIFALFGCTSIEQRQNSNNKPVLPKLKVSENQRYLIYQTGEPFFWLGGTVWGMAEWLPREDVDYYLDNREEKGFTVLQMCVFWGKRHDDPKNFMPNSLNAYGHKAFVETKGHIDSTRVDVVEGGSPQQPNDYWDHVEYIIQACDKRDMMVAILPVWGRRYVNATHKNFSKPVFSVETMKSYGEFLGRRFKTYPNIIWVMGGDVQADEGGNYLEHYRSMAEGITQGITSDTVKWDQESPLWDYTLMTYHPSGKPLLNSSTWFHHDTWLDFNMIETWDYRNDVYDAVQQDYNLPDPIKPTVLGEPGYEDTYPQQKKKMLGLKKGIQMRRQAYHSFFGGACGFTYGAFRDEDGNGPLYSPYKGWKKLLDIEGAHSMTFMKSFLIKHKWTNWIPAHNIITEHEGRGELQKVSVIIKPNKECLVYFPDNSIAELDVSGVFPQVNGVDISWYNTALGQYSDKIHVELSDGKMEIAPPDSWADAVLIILADTMK